MRRQDGQLFERAPAVHRSQAVKMAVGTRGGRAAIWREDEYERVVSHSDRGSTYTSNACTKLCRQQGIRQSMGRVGSCFDNAAAEAFFSSLEWEVLSRHGFADTTRPRPLCWTGVMGSRTMVAGPAQRT